MIDVPMTEEAKANNEWQTELARHVRGFKVSDLPMKVVMSCTWEDGRTVDFVQTFRVMPVYTKVLVGGVLQDRPTIIRVEKDYPLPMGWSYWEYAEKVEPGGPWSPLDMPNPRLYSMDGGLLSNPPERGMATELEHSFKQALGGLWQIELGSSASIPVNERRFRIFELLDHHSSRGGNPTSFRDFIGELTRNPMGMPPPPTEGSLLLESFGAEREPLRDPEGLSVLLLDWIARGTTGPRSKAGKRERSEAEEARPEPTLASKFADVPGSLDKWNILLRSEGLMDSSGRFTLDSDAKGKGKLIAAWVAAREVFGLTAYPQDSGLSRALIAHFPDLTGLGRLDKIRRTKGFSSLIEGYKEVLQDD